MEGEGLDVAVEAVIHTFLNNSFMLMKVFKLCSFHRFLDHHLLQLFFFVDKRLELGVVGGSHSGLALRAVQVVEHYTRSIIFFLN